MTQLGENVARETIRVICNWPFVPVMAIIFLFLSSFATAGEVLKIIRTAYPSAEKGFDCAIESDDLKHVMVLLEKMDKREASVLKMRFGIDGDEPKTLKEIGECLGLTRERVRQIESEALAKLYDNMSAE